MAEPRRKGAVPTQAAAAAAAPEPVDAAGRAVGWWIAGVAAAPRRALLALVSLCLLAAIAATGLRVDSDSSKMLSPDLPFQARANALNAAFPDLKRAIVVVVQAETADDADAALSALANRLAARSDVVASVFAPSIDPFFQSHGFLYGDAAAVERRLTALSSSANMIAALRAAPTLEGFFQMLAEAAALSAEGGGDPAALDPLLRETAAVIERLSAGAPRAFDWGGALSGAEPTGRAVVRAMSVQPVLDFTRLNPAKAALAAVSAEIAALPPEIRGAVEIGVTGDPALRADELRSVTQNLALSLGLSLAAVAMLLRLAFRSKGRALLAFAALCATLVLTAGAAAVLTNPLNLVSVAFVVLMVGLGIDYAIHLMFHIEEARRAGAETVPALVRAGRAVGGPLALSVATTAASFLAFTTTDFVGMAQLGLIGGVGVAIALATAATAIPAAVAIWPRLAVGGAPRPVATVTLTAGAATLLRGARRLAPAAALIAAVGAAALAVQARFDADPMNLRPAAAPSVAAYQTLAMSGGATPLRLSVLADTPAAAAAAAERLSAAPEVRAAAWLGDLTPADQAEKLMLFDIAYPGIEYAVSGPPVSLRAESHAPSDLAALLRERVGTPAAARLALAIDGADLADPATRAALEQAVFRHFPRFIGRIEAMLAADAVTPDMLPAALIARYRSETGLYRVDVTPAGDAGDPTMRQAFIAAVSAAAPEAAGGALQIEAAGATVASSILQATALSFAATAVFAFAWLRAIGPVVAIIAPLCVAGVMTAAASAALDLPFNYANVIVLPLMIGIGVDSGVHLAMRGAALGRRVSLLDTTTPRAVVYSALTTMAAFGALGLSEHRGTASMGLMLMIGVGSALFAVLLLTPPLARLGAGRRDGGMEP